MTDRPPDPTTPTEQIERYHEVVERLGSEGAPKVTKPPGKLGAEKLTSEEQRRRFEELAREAGCDEISEA